MSFANLRNIGRVQAKLERRVKRYQAGWRERYQEELEQVLEDLMIASPQWSGNFVANWVVKVGKDPKNTGEYAPYGSKGPWRSEPPNFRGNPVAMTVARSRNPLPDRIPLTWSARFYNNTPYGQAIYRNIPTAKQDRNTFLRPGNWLGPSHIPIKYAQIQAKARL